MVSMNPYKACLPQPACRINPASNQGLCTNDRYLHSVLSDSVISSFRRCENTPHVCMYLCISTAKVNLADTMVKLLKTCTPCLGVGAISVPATCTF